MHIVSPPRKEGSATLPIGYPCSSSPSPQSNYLLKIFRKNRENKHELATTSFPHPVMGIMLASTYFMGHMRLKCSNSYQDIWSDTWQI